MHRKLLALAVASLTLTGCYRATVITSAQPSPTVIDVPFQHSFVLGLVPPKEINTSQQCPNGVAKVVTEQSFLNGVVNYFVGIVYSPIHVTVTCANR
jgi:hypothetical protein